MGHTLDDNAETILMRVIKGTGIKGLAGIPPVRSFGTFKIIRPLIEIEKKPIQLFLKQSGIKYRIDQTNKDEAFLRNKVRRRLLPYLKRYNSRVKFALSNMAESLREDLELIENQRLAKKGLIDRDKDSIFLNLRDLVIQPKTLQREIMRDALARSGANIKKLRFNHWKALREFIKFKRNGQSIDLPGDIRITRTNNKIVFKGRRHV